MFASLHKLSVILLALVAVGTNAVLVDKPFVSLPLSRRFNNTGARNILMYDQARARMLRAKAEGHTQLINEPLLNVALGYIASIGVGRPPTYYDLFVDTGSSNTWVGAGKKYVRTKTSRKTRDSVSVRYGSGSFSGVEYIDNLTIGQGFTIRQSIGVASASAGFSGVDGILGIGPTDLTLGTLSPDSSSTIPTVVDNAYEQGFIRTEKLGISFVPYVEFKAANGEISWGGVDRSKYISPITYTPITSTFPSNLYWGIDQDIMYGTSTPILTDSSGIVDTGTTLLLLASDAFATYAVATGGTIDPSVGLLSISPAQYANLKSLFFIINGASFELTANAQIWPRALNTAIGGKANAIYLIVADIGVDSGSGLDFINGYTFLQRFYAVFDTKRSMVGIANTPFTEVTTN